MKLTITISIVLCYLLTINIYNFSLTGINGQEINFNDFQGRKILLVNIATGSDKADQLASLQQLQNNYPDSLVVIGFPSNSFGHESMSNADIKQYCDSAYGVHFLLASQGDVKGNGIQSIYYWLTHSKENGFFDIEVKDDFQKFLIDSNGELLGVFAPAVSPLSSQITDQLTTQN